MKEIYYWFNVFEAILWSAIAIALWLKSYKNLVQFRSLSRIAAITFLLFGISDVIELKTGAWWRPVELLLLKAGCVITLIGCLLAYLRHRKRKITHASRKENGRHENDAR